jgi:hypothetical protein
MFDKKGAIFANARNASGLGNGRICTFFVKHFFLDAGQDTPSP